MSLDDVHDHSLGDEVVDEIDDEEEEEEDGEDDAPDQDGEDDASPNKNKGKRKRDGSTFRKAPQAPKRFKSSYICFFMAKQPEIKDELGDKATVTAISKRSAEMWKSLPPEERAHWDDVAAKDKQRYNAEKASYTGPWQIPWKRARKDPSAPKRPMSAFLYFSQGKRAQIKKDQPDMKNTEISRMLGGMWRSLSDEERRPHIEKEKEEREKYKVAIAEWRKDFEAKQEAQKKAQSEQQATIPMPDQHPQMFEQYPQFPSPYLYHPFPSTYPPTGPYQYATNGRQPVVLNPNGLPIYQAQAQQPYVASAATPMPLTSASPTAPPTIQHPHHPTAQVPVVIAPPPPPLVPPLPQPLPTSQTAPQPPPSEQSIPEPQQPGQMLNNHSGGIDESSSIHGDSSSYQAALQIFEAHNHNINNVSHHDHNNMNSSDSLPLPPQQLPQEQETSTENDHHSIYAQTEPAE